MKKLLLFILPFLFTGCGSTGSSKGDRHQMELSLHRVRTEVEGVKHDLNTYEIEYHVVTGKLADQKQAIDSLKQQVAELKSGKLDSFVQELEVLSKRIRQIIEKQDQMVVDIRKLSSCANDTTTALAQYKEKIAQFEEAIHGQNLQLSEVQKIREGITKFTEEGRAKTYTVKHGDSLEKIAREHHTSVEEIKHINGMSADLIVVDQQLVLP